MNPAFDFVEKNAEYEITAELPGIDEKNIEIKLSNHLLTIRGQKSESKEENDKDYFLSERRFGSFQRSFRVPEGVDTDRIDANFSKGLLTLHLPKSAEARSLGLSHAARNQKPDAEEPRGEAGRDVRHQAEAGANMHCPSSIGDAMSWAIHLGTDPSLRLSDIRIPRRRPGKNSGIGPCAGEMSARLGGLDVLLPVGQAIGSARGRRRAWVPK